MKWTISHRCPKGLENKGKDNIVTLTQKDPKEDEFRNIMVLPKERECLLMERGKSHNLSIIRSTCLNQGLKCNVVPFEKSLGKALS